MDETLLMHKLTDELEINYVYTNHTLVLKQDFSFQYPPPKLLINCWAIYYIIVSFEPMNLTQLATPLSWNQIYHKAY